MGSRINVPRGPIPDSMIKSTPLGGAKIPACTMTEVQPEHQSLERRVLLPIPAGKTLGSVSPRVSKP